LNVECWEAWKCALGNEKVYVEAWREKLLHRAPHKICLLSPVLCCYGPQDAPAKPSLDKPIGRGNHGDAYRACLVNLGYEAFSMVGTERAKNSPATAIFAKCPSK